MDVILWDDADRDTQVVIEGELTRKIKMLSDLSGGLRTQSLKSIHCRDDLVESVMLYVKQRGIARTQLPFPSAVPRPHSISPLL